MNASRKYIVAAFALALNAAPLASQSLTFVRRTVGYGAYGAGVGSFKLICDSGCVGINMSSMSGALVLGRTFGTRGERRPGRVRAELGFNYQSSSEYSSNVFGASLGVAVYVGGNLHVRGAGSYMRASIEDATGTYEGGGPGFTVGAAYDLYLGRSFALSPFVNVAAASVSSINASGPGGTGSTSGSLRALNFGVTASIIRGTYWCTTGSGQPIKVNRRNLRAATMLGCLR